MNRSMDKLPLIILALLAVLSLRCEPTPGRNWDGPSRERGSRSVDPGMESNIIRVIKFFSADPWLCFKNDGTGRVDGVRLTVYLEGTREPKGVFGTGTIIVEMYRLDMDARKRETATLAHKWELSSDDAYPWRAKNRTGMGWGYGLRLQWPADLDVSGRQVAFVVKYRREDGALISSSRQVIRVPTAAKSVPLGS
jgi:hypothetical protein